jgi:hypothetical protein
VVSMSVATRRARRRCLRSSPTEAPQGSRRSGPPRGAELRQRDRGAPPRPAITVPLTSGLDGRAHEISAEEWARGSRSGQYVAVCGAEVVAASLHHPPGPWCPACEVNAPSPTPAPPSAPSPSGRWLSLVRLLREMLAAEERLAKQTGWESTPGRWGSRTYRDPRFDRLAAGAGAEEVAVR